MDTEKTVRLQMGEPNIIAVVHSFPDELPALELYTYGNKFCQIQAIFKNKTIMIEFATACN